MPAWQPPMTSEGAIGGGADGAACSGCAERAAWWSFSPQSPPPFGSIHELREPGAPQTAASCAPRQTRPRRDRHRRADHIGCPPARRGFASARLRELPAPVQDAAVAVLGDRAYAFGGLDSGGGSTTAVSVVRGSSVRSAGRLPLAIHDAAAAPSGPGRLVVLGGGQVASYAGIAAFDPATGGVRIVGRLPRRSPTFRSRRWGGTTYAVGGFTGAAWSDGIVAIDAGRARQVARLPIGLRDAAVAAVATPS